MAEPFPDQVKNWVARTGDMVRPMLPKRLRGGIPVVPVVRLAGVIGMSAPLRPGLTLAGVARPLERAFKWRKARAVALLINSPGGSAVQSHFIYKRIRALAERYDVPVIAFVEDAAASGGYMIACAADEIIADPSSVVGSIGVVGGTFGFDKLMEKIGVERRLYTAGKSKAMLDPFLPEKPEEVERIKAIQRNVHLTFIDLVKSRRGDKLAGPDVDLFTGEYWTGRQGLDLGLVDGLGDVKATLIERFGKDVEMPLVAPERSFFGRRPGGIERGAFALPWSAGGMADDLLAAIEARAIWARLGL